MRQRLASEGGEGGDPGTPATRQLVDEAADMLSNLLASPDKVPMLKITSPSLPVASISSTPALGMPAAWQLAGETADVLSNLLASPDRVPTLNQDECRRSMPPSSSIPAPGMLCAAALGLTRPWSCSAS